MAKSTTFIHASDLHLGAAFRGVRDLSPVWADRMLKSIPDAYRQFIDYALTESIDFVIISGDVFDSSHPSYADFCLFCDGLAKLGEANIPVYYCTGNHDPFTMWIHDYGDLPDNVFMFDPNEASFFVFEKDGEPLVVLGGRSYYNQTWPAGQDISEGISRETALRESPDAPFCVGVIHTGLDIDPTRSPVKPKELLKRHMDYWACGHIHHVELVPERDPSIAFAGCIQGRDIHETGPHGVLKVTLRQNMPADITFLPTAQVVWERIEVDVASCTTISDIQEAITTQQFERNADSQCQNMLCRITLTGATPLHRELSTRVLEDLRLVINDRYPFFFIDAIVNDTRAQLDRKALEKEGLFPAVYLSTMAHLANDKTEGLTYIEQQFADRDLPVPHFQRHFEELCSQAETLVLDLLNEKTNK
ncbi:metallophosphoesterase family protein [Anaerotardibacter muris]|uniref:metallophosphoesterase family protein n=1 Tax=Anaerotardibacter muris TaxID=2941505 RepID=UPI00203B944E|nr:DNA repair exonuclease [Anaerotardibacter muris]